MNSLPPLALLLFLAAPPNAAPSLDAALQPLARAAREREDLRAERERQATQAGALAERIEALKSAAAGTRASSELAAALRGFGRLAESVERLDAKLASGEKALAEARRAWDETVRIEEQRTPTLPDVEREARRLAIDTARRRADELAPPIPMEFRPLLEIEVAPTDDGPALEDKLTVLRAETARGEGELRRLTVEAALTRATIELRQRRLAQTRTFSGAAGSGLALLQREADALKLELRAILARQTMLERSRASLERALERLQDQLRRAESRRGSQTGYETTSKEERA